MEAWLTKLSYYTRPFFSERTYADAATLFDAGADVVIPDVTKLSLELLAEAPAAAAAA